MIYLYGLVAAPAIDLTDALGAQQGLQGPLQTAQTGPWTIVFSDHDDLEILPKRRLLLRHTQILESLLPLATVLPARFGLVAQDITQVTALIEESAAQINTQFAKVQGAVEVGLRISFPKQPALDATLHANPALQAERTALSRRGPEAHFAIAEFGGRLAETLDRRRGHAQRQLLSALRPLARDHVLRKPEEDTEVLRAEFLIDMNAQESFQERIAATVATLDFAPGAEPTIQLIGPVPMYNFVHLNLTFDNNKEAA